MAKGLHYYTLFPGETHIIYETLYEVFLVEKGLGTSLVSTVIFLLNSLITLIDMPC